MNDIVGDYRQNYKCATEIGNTVREKLAKSDMIRIIVALLENWLKFRKNPPKVNQNDKFGEVDIESERRDP